MKRVLLILLVTSVASLNAAIENLPANQHSNDTTVANALAQSIKKIIETKEFPQEIGNFLAKYANQIKSGAEPYVRDQKELQKIIEKIQRYAQLYKSSGQHGLLCQFTKEENKLNKKLYKALEQADDKKSILDEHDKAMQALHTSSKYSQIKELALLHDELTALGLDVLMQLQKLYGTPEAFTDFIHNAVVLVQKEFATNINT